MIDCSGRKTASETVRLSVAETMIEMLVSADAVVSCDQARAKKLIDRVVEMLRMNAEADGPSRVRSRGGLAPWQARRLKAHIENHLSTPMTASDLADVVNLSRSYFCRAFKTSFGKAPHAYLITRRTIRAQEMMLMTDESLSKIAVACGLVDQAHLSKLFRRTVGSTPHAWRRALKGVGRVAFDKPVEIRTGLSAENIPRPDSAPELSFGAA
jgi:AraC-like DNA-binding protein